MDKLIESKVNADCFNGCVHENYKKVIIFVSDSFAVAFQAILGSYYRTNYVRFNEVKINLGNG